ncbi:MAG TPA: SDR family NAD(P)-dependent oxidoreductase [Gaiellaceae bacterium]|nr:SDR family NAD(P)-dependent oxidoreductase [Gaiellaceae bacterium]
MRTGARNGHTPAAELGVASLLGRPVVDVDVAGFCGYLADATVLVTGAGGSIGAELCAQLVRRGVGELVLVDQAEASLAAVVRRLADDLGFRDAAPVLADIKSPERTASVFEEHRPAVVFHAAAYKHVPLLEASPTEGVATNVLGTKCVVDAARRTRVGRFVLFSTDKAVEPASILGQTKAVAEWIVAAAGREAAVGRYTSVRLANVVDSTGSILPVFRQQIARGGPLTVTHPAVTRYLMTADEAAKLAIVAGGLGDAGGILWLDSGPPVTILDLARRLASAASHDVAVEFIGLRMGERLHERLYSSGDEIAATPCEHVWRASASHVDPAWLNGWLSVLARHVERASATGVRAALAEMITAPERRGARQTAVVA